MCMLKRTNTKWSFGVQSNKYNAYRMVQSNTAITNTTLKMSTFIFIPPAFCEEVHTIWYEKF